MCGDQEESDVTNLSWCHSVRPFFTSGEVGLGWERMQSQPSMAPPLQTLHRSQLSGPVSGLHGHHGDAFCHAQWSPGVLYFCGSLGSGARLSVDTTATPFLGFWESGPLGACFSEDLGVLPYLALGIFVSAPTPPGLPNNLRVFRLLQKETVCR